MTTWIKKALNSLKRPPKSPRIPPTPGGDELKERATVAGLIARPPLKRRDARLRLRLLFRLGSTSGRTLPRSLSGAEGNVLGTPSASVVLSTDILGKFRRARRFWRLQISDQPLECFLIRVVVLPIAEVGDEILANLAGGILSSVGVEAFPVAQSFKRREPNGEQDSPLVAHLARPGLGDLGLHPLARHAVRRQDQKQLVVQTDCFVDLFVQFPAALNVVRRKPAAYAFGLQVSVEAVGEGLIFGGVADEA